MNKLAGTWLEKDGKRIVVVGNRRNGSFVVENECGTIEIIHGFLVGDGWKVLPGCTGFDWVKPEKDEPPVDWATQDLALSRPNKDEFRWVNSDYKSQWTKCYEGGLQHGAIRGGMKLEIRCRREDLPEIPDPAKPSMKTLFQEVVRPINPDTHEFEVVWTSLPKDKDRATGNTRLVVIR